MAEENKKLYCIQIFSVFGGEIYYHSFYEYAYEVYREATEDGISTVHLYENGRAISHAFPFFTSTLGSMRMKQFHYKFAVITTGKNYCNVNFFTSAKEAAKRSTHKYEKCVRVHKKEVIYSFLQKVFADYTKMYMQSINQSNE